MSEPTLVITSINPPTMTVRKARAVQPDWRIIVVGDKKTPEPWKHDGVDFLSISDQGRLRFELAAALPLGHYSRKNLGYLVAIADGAPIIAETDDDNIPYDSFLAGVSRTVRARPIEATGWVNVYRAFTSERVWPRGFPLDAVNESLRAAPPLGQDADHDCPVQQYLADGDPDVDAVYRLTAEGDIRFDESLDVVLGPGSHCPFNSQNTVWFPDAYPLLYLPSGVSFRMTDIWRSFVAARCLDALGHPLAFRRPTVVQERNEHDLMRDFEAEIDGYLRNREIVERLAALDLGGLTAGQMLRRCYEELAAMGLVDHDELVLVDLWLDALGSIGS